MKCWSKITKINCSNHRELDTYDECYYLYTRETHNYNDGFNTWSMPYQVIENFKIKPSTLKVSPNRTCYKENAICTITNDLHDFLLGLDSSANYLLVPTVTSRCFNDPDFDDRLIRVCENASADINNVTFSNLLTLRKSVPSAHSSGGSRNSDSLFSLIEVVSGFSVLDYQAIILFDDVISSGAHFKACKKSLQSVYGNIWVIGVFWARTAFWGEE